VLFAFSGEEDPPKNTPIPNRQKRTTSRSPL
jgi:hypothetical protein